MNVAAVDANKGLLGSTGYTYAGSALEKKQVIWSSKNIAEEIQYGLIRSTCKRSFYHKKC